jgi:Family of unknown function (DUF6521)
MERLEQWTRRPIEEANLFNPPFICALIHEFLKEFSNDRKNGASIFLVIIALATSLHRASRERLPYSTVTPLYAWVQENEDLLIGFASRAKNIGPYVKEAIMFGIAAGTLELGDGSLLVLGTKKATFTKRFLDETTAEMRSIVERSRFIGRWLAKSGSEISIAAVLGVRP